MCIRDSLYDVLRRINSGLGKTEEDYYRAVSESFMVSADNAHAVHPNHPQKTDVENCVYMNEGIVIKSHAGQKYTSDAVSIAIFRNICKQAGVPVQFLSLIHIFRYFPSQYFWDEEYI